MRSSSMLVRVTSLVAVQSVTSISYQLRIDDPGLVFPACERWDVRLVSVVDWRQLLVGHGSSVRQVACCVK